MERERQREPETDRRMAVKHFSHVKRKRERIVLTAEALASKCLLFISFITSLTHLYLALHVQYSLWIPKFNS